MCEELGSQLRKFTLGEIESPNGGKMNYWVLLPNEEGLVKPSRIIMFLHGRGRAVKNPEVVFEYGVPEIREMMPDTVIVVPHYPDPDREEKPNWINHTNTLLKLAKEMRDKFGLKLDLLGFSMGGKAALHIASNFPDTFARYVAISPSRIPEGKKLDSLKQVNLRVFYGENDVPLIIDNCEHLAQIIGPEKVTKLPGITHTEAPRETISHLDW